MTGSSLEGRTAATLVSFERRPDERFGGRVRRLLPALLERLLLWQQRANDRAHLARLTEHDLRDIGLKRADIEQEITKAFWRP